MHTILLSINPDHVNNIFNGSKKYEFRRVRCKVEVSKILIYSTSPTMKVVGEAEVENVLEEPLDDLWGMTFKEAGVEKEFFYRYYRGKSYGIAYELNNIVQYSEERPLSYYGLKSAPQSFAYVNQE